MTTKSEHFLPNHPPLDDERSHRSLAGGYIADIVYAANDGIVTTFAVVAGSEGAALSQVAVIALGYANLLADGFSMGAGNYLGIRSRLQFEQRERQVEEYEVENWPEVEKEEIREIYRRKGLTGHALELATEAITSKKELWVEEMMTHEHGIAPGSEKNPLRHGTVSFISFLVAGSLPLMPFLFLNSGHRFGWACGVTGISLFLVGSLRTMVTGASWWKSGCEVLAVGGVAAGLAYGVGLLVGWISR